MKKMTLTLILMMNEWLYLKYFLNYTVRLRFTLFIIEIRLMDMAFDKKSL